MDRITKILLAALTLGVWALVMGQSPAAVAMAKSPDLAPPASPQQISAAGVFMVDGRVTAYDPTSKALMSFPFPDNPFVIIRDGKISVWMPTYNQDNEPTLKKVEEKPL